jgi:hypothetical protein
MDDLAGQVGLDKVERTGWTGRDRRDRTRQES